eukprot:433421_1
MMANEEFPLTNIEDANVVAKLCKRILDNPSDCKYQSICVEKLYTKLNDYKNVLGLLNELGFHETSDHKRLIFDMNHSNLENLKYFYSTSLMLQTGCLVHPDDAKLIRKVFSNILTYPNNIKYQSIRCSMLNTKLKDYKRALILFDEVGFIKSSDNKRLVFIMNEDNMYKLLGFYNIAVHIASNQNDTENTYLNGIRFKGISPENKDDSTLQNKHDDRKYDFLPSDILSTEHNLSNCASMKIIRKCLKQYLVNINTVTISTNNVKLLDHFNHLLCDHANQFEQIYSALNEYIYDNNGCDLETCKSFRRNRRDRAAITENENIFSHIYSSDDSIVGEQIRDRIHCHFFHAFDIGLKITSKDKESVIKSLTESKYENQDYKECDESITKMKKLVQSKQKKRCEITNHLNQKK